jgi:microcystin-dependent protein
MSNPYIGEIRLFAGNFAPAGWMFCEGQLIPISENDALFTLIGTTYGGDGQNTFALPDLRGRVPIHQGQGPGISNNYILGEALGAEEVTLTVQNLPVHSHQALCHAGGSNNTTNPQNAVWNISDVIQYTSIAPNASMHSSTVAPVGGSQPHENMTPFLGIYYIISLFGIFPAQ